MQEFLTAKRAEIAEVCRAHHVRRLAVFGSAAREDFDPERSDVDLRVEFNEVSVERYAENYFSLREAFAALFGRKVDLISAKTIRNPYFRSEVAATQVELYAA
jgi:predicted nucleotidyltransferase